MAAVMLTVLQLRSCLRRGWRRRWARCENPRNAPPAPAPLLRRDSDGSSAAGLRYAEELLRCMRWR